MNAIEFLKITASFVGGGLFTFVGSWAINRAKGKDIQADAWGKLVIELQKEVSDMRKEVNNLREDNVELHKKVATLEAERITLMGRIQHLETELAAYKRLELETKS